MRILKVKDWLQLQKEKKKLVFLETQRDYIKKNWEESGLLTGLIGLPKKENIALMFESQARQLITGLDIQPEPSTFKTKEQS